MSKSTPPSFASMMMAERSEYFQDLVTDTIEALVMQPEKVQIGFHENPTVPGEMVIDVVGPRSEIAMIVGAKGSTAKALQRVFFCQARNLGLATSVLLSWAPVAD